MGEGLLAGRRVLAIGASTGIGRAFALDAARGGADLIATARRTDALEALVAEAGAGRAVAADICDEAQRAALLDAVAEQFGQVDLVVHSVGFATLKGLVDADEATWHDTLDVNVVALNQLIRGLVNRDLLAPGGIVAVLSSETVFQPRAGLAAYAASKAALEASIRGWRVEHPDVRFSIVAVGATFPTDFGSRFDGDELGRVFPIWARHGLIQDKFMVTDEVGAYLVTVFGGALAVPGIGVEHIVLRSPSPVMGSAQEAAGYRSAPGLEP